MEKKIKVVISHRLHDAGMKVLEDAGAASSSASDRSTA